jgi:hypothetical protein
LSNEKWGDLKVVDSLGLPFTSQANCSVTHTWILTGGLNYEAPIRRDGYGDTSTAIRDTAISKNSDSAIREYMYENNKIKDHKKE